MQKYWFISRVARASNLTRAEVARALSGISQIAAEGLREEGRVRIPGLVTLKREYRAERLVRNPRNGTRFVLAPFTLTRARPVNSFRRRVKSENPAPQ